MSAAKPATHVSPRKRATLTAASLVCAVGAAFAIPGFHINDDASAKRAVQLYADHSAQFATAAYQAQQDKSIWRLTLAAHEYLQEKPGDPERECSFAEAYWQSQQALRKASTAGETDVENIPPDAVKRLAVMDAEAVYCTKDAVRRMPNSVAAHLNYGYYIQFFDLMDNKQGIARMLNEYQKAVSLRPNLGYTHYALAGGYMGSGDFTPKTIDYEISQFQQALALDSRLTQSYYYLAALYSGPSKRDYKTSRFYLGKYLQLNPQEINSPIVVPLDKFLMEKGS